jgi:hypothetical protein
MTLLVAANVAVALLLATASELFDLRWPSWLSAVTLGIMFGQVGTVSAWLVHGGAHLSRRLVSAAICMPLWAILADGATGRGSFEEWLTLLLIYSGSLCLTLFVMRILRPRTTRDSASSRTTPDGKKRRWQFSIASLFGVTTLVAVLAGALRWLDVPLHVLGELLTICLPLAVAAFVSFAATARIARPTIVLPLLAVVCPSAGVFLSLTVANGNDMPLFVLLTAIQGAWIALLVRVARVAETSDAFAEARAHTAACAIEGPQPGLTYGPDA